MKTLTAVNTANRSFLLAILAICFLASGGIFVRLSTLPPIHTGFYRVLFSVFILYPFVKSKLRQLDVKTMATIIIAGVFLALDLILWNISFHLTSVANANLFANLVPFTMIPVAYFVFKERLQPRFFLGVAITLAGIFLLVSGKINPTFSNYQGDLLAFATSVFYALFLLTVYTIRDKVDALTIMFISAFGSLPVLFGAMVWREGFYVPQTFTDLYPLICLAVLSQILGQGLLSYCMGKLPVAVASLVVLTQPLVAAVYAYILFHERLSFLEMAGMLVALTGIFFAKRS
ncbi:MAG TPA: DMT family transporter [Chitinophaga sp.]|uniref:DMT family transporter n=1 Tax=Chitinophaga sp. TaxID=1869181 RepID=UPI002F941DE0